MTSHANLHFEVVNFNVAPKDGGKTRRVRKDDANTVTVNRLVWCIGGVSVIEIRSRLGIRIQFVTGVFASYAR